VFFFGGGRSRNRESGKGGGGGAIILILIAIAVFVLARFLAIALRFAMSRKREYLADAGAVDLTKNPDAMISALRKIAGHSEIQAPAQVQEMFLDMPARGLFATHPSIEKRIAALVEYAGGQDLPVTATAGTAAVAQTAAPSEPPGDAPTHGPWG
jgi:heat shock protein HtpX